MTEKAVNFAEKLFTIFLLLVIFSQTVLILSMSRVKPADVIVSIKQLEDAIGISNHIVANNHSNVKKEINDINDWMKKVSIAMDDSVKDRIYKEDIIKWVRQVKELNPEIDLPDIEEIRSNDDYVQPTPGLRNR
jgi:hypothetical protein